MSQSMAGQKTTMAVLDLGAQGTSKAEAALAGDLMRNEFVQAGTFDLVEKQRMDSILGELAFQHTGATDLEKAVQLGQLLNVRKVVVGTLALVEGRRSLVVRMVDIETGKVESSAVESGLKAPAVQPAVARVVRTLCGLPPVVEQESLSGWLSHGTVRYAMFYAGPNAGSIINFHAESVFHSGPNAPDPNWTVDSPEAQSKETLPGFGLRLGAWKRWFGGDLEISYLSHHLPEQNVPYDAKGFVYIPQYDVYVPADLDQVALPNRFLRMSSLGFGGNLYIHLPGKILQPYIGVGAGLLMNRVKSDYPGPGSFALKLEGQALNSTSLGTYVQIPLGLRYPLSKKTFVYLEGRAALHHFSFVSSDAFLREKDRFTLQTFQAVFGYGLMFR